MALHQPATSAILAVVARHPVRTLAEEYLILGDGAPRWTQDARRATPFPSMRDATRAALRLASGDRAFGLPLRTELNLGLAH